MLGYSGRPFSRLQDFTQGFYRHTARGYLVEEAGKTGNSAEDEDGDMATMRLTDGDLRKLIYCGGGTRKQYNKYFTNEGHLK